MSRKGKIFNFEDSIVSDMGWSEEDWHWYWFCMYQSAVNANQPAMANDKIKKPKMLKGLKAIKSFDLVGKKANVFDLGNGDLVLHFGTLFSTYASFPDEKDMTMPTSALAAKYGWNKRGFKSFTYPDAWCTIYNRNEGYILVKGLKHCFDELYCINVASISEKLYSCIRIISLKDSRFFMLRLVPTDVESANYSRLCEDITNWLYIEKRNLITK